LLPVAVFIKDPERLSQFFLAVSLFHLLRHHVQKLVKVDRAVAFTVPYTTSAKVIWQKAKLLRQLVRPTFRGSMGLTVWLHFAIASFFGWRFDPKSPLLLVGVRNSYKHIVCHLTEPQVYLPYST